jgi:hypothetical protein
MNKIICLNGNYQLRKYPRLCFDLSTEYEQNILVERFFWMRMQYLKILSKKVMCYGHILRSSQVKHMNKKVRLE